MVAVPERPPWHRGESESGYTLVELVIAAAIMTVVLGGTIMLAMQMQQAYGTELNDVEVEQEARYALDWISRDLRSAGNDPYDVILPNQEVWIDPNGGADPNDSIRVQADIAPPGPDGDIGDPGENVTIAFDPANKVITRQDSNGANPAAQAMTDAIVTDLSFAYLNVGHAPTVVPDQVAYVQVQVKARSRARNPRTGAFTESTLSNEVRLRGR